MFLVVECCQTTERKKKKKFAVIFYNILQPTSDVSMNLQVNAVDISTEQHVYYARWWYNSVASFFLLTGPACKCCLLASKASILWLSYISTSSSCSLMHWLLVYHLSLCHSILLYYPFYFHCYRGFYEAVFVNIHLLYILILTSA